MGIRLSELEKREREREREREKYRKEGHVEKDRDV